MKTETLETRVNGFFRELRKQGFIAKRNVQSCCRSCANLGEVGEKPLVWSFGGQGSAVSIKGDEAYLANSKDGTVDSFYLYHDNLTSEDGLNENGVKFLRLAAKYEVPIIWDATDFKAIEVVTTTRKGN